MKWFRWWRRIERIDFFHIGCTGTVRPQPYRYVYVPDGTNEMVLSQAHWVCEGCGERLHADVWPMQTIDPAMWGAKR
jgi:hypothetical protein